MRLTIQDIIQKKKNAQKITMLTAYDYSMAKIVDQAGVDMILVGDSLANVVLGLPTTKEVSLEIMLTLTQAVNRAVSRSLLIGDMPYEAYQKNPRQAVKNARRFIEEAGCQAVKIEWFDGCLTIVRNIIRAGIPVMGHVGLTPQTADQLGGYKVQGTHWAQAQVIREQAIELEKQGCFSVVLECIPDKLADIITASVKIPTIGIGAGAGCDGQVLVIHDLLGLTENFGPKFVQRYAQLNKMIHQAVVAFKNDVLSGAFPTDQHTFHMKKEELKNLQDALKKSRIQ